MSNRECDSKGPGESDVQTHCRIQNPTRILESDPSDPIYLLIKRAYINLYDVLVSDFSWSRERPTPRRSAQIVSRLRSGEVQRWPAVTSRSRVRRTSEPARPARTDAESFALTSFGSKSFDGRRPFTNHKLFK
ncbi:hypothetical protein EVAR_23642_1 [Eumeta japonica]|uniref:Uncharacterized protein n=1 Tax=Eumeta variegata TaxID=151549 RepID=A0A4C1VH45_EUMVA|nr:hypothetical protein EVAR_23642_1 [Eumeta japonica]